MSENRDQVRLRLKDGNMTVEETVIVDGGLPAFRRQFDEARASGTSFTLRLRQPSEYGPTIQVIPGEVARSYGWEE